MTEENFVSFIYKYRTFTNIYYPFIKHTKTIENLIDGNIDFVEGKVFFIELQRFIYNTIKKFLHLSEINKKEFIQIPGKTEFLFNKKSKKFEGYFLPSMLYKSNSTDLDTEKAILEFIFFDQILKRDINPNRINRCKRCVGLFYQFTAMKKNHCSSGCSNALRQKKYIAKKAKEVM
jgi:hypothetical protein